MLDIFVEFLIRACCFGGVEIASSDDMRIYSVEVKGAGDKVEVAEG